MPKFNPAENCSLSLLMLFSIEARHIEHWAYEFNWNRKVPTNKTILKMTFLSIILIIGSDEQIYHNS